MSNSLFTYNTARLGRKPGDGFYGSQDAWDALESAFGTDTFHPIEARGILMSAYHVRRSEANTTLQTMLDRGFIIAP